MLARQPWQIFLFIILAFFASGAVAQEERVPVDSIRQPSDDLIYNGRRLTAEQAWKLQQDAFSPLDLSTLNPADSEVWKNRLISNLDPNSDQIPLQEKDVYSFKGTLISNQGIIRFNVVSENEGSQVFTILMEKTLHTTLLRRNLLRKLGYVIPAMKYLPSLKVSFQNIEERDFFLSKQLPEATYGAPSRWLGRDHTTLEDHELTLTFKDVVALMPSETDHYNVAMGLPPKRITNRTLRSLLIPYALLNLGESVNKFPWSVGRIDNESFILPHFTSSTINTAVEDARWSLRRMASLDKTDFQEIVERSFFPRSVAKLVLEKLVSRRNSLVKLFRENFKELNVDVDVSDGELLKNGRLTQEDWEGYASRFAHGEPDSPFKDFRYFLFSKIQNSMLTNLVDLVNDKISLFDPSEKKLDFARNQFEEGLEQFVETGEFLEFGVGAWFSPLLDGQLIVSRDIVVGNYLGTDNMVQLADTIGVGVYIGAMMGLENIPNLPSASIRGGLNAVRTYTHLKPVKTLKASFKEPYRNLLVPIIKMQLKRKLNELAEISTTASAPVGVDDTDPRLVAIEELLEVINSQLGVGESILVTDRLTPNLAFQGGLNMMDTRVSMGSGLSGLMVRRLHLFRKDAKTIQVYEDKGKGWTFSFSANIDNKIPIIRLSSAKTNGKYEVKKHAVDINTDLKENPNLFSNAKALHYLLEEGSSELLEINSRPYKVETDFVDRSTKFSFLVWRAKYLKGDADFLVTTPQGYKTEYMSLTAQAQSGINYQSFAYDVLNHYMKDVFKDLPITPSLDPERFKNPGQSIFGVSVTDSARFEARKKEELIYQPFLSLSSRREGWSAKTKKLKEYVKEVNEEYGTDLFNPSDLNDASALRLFDINVNVNIYEDGIEKLKQLKEKNIRSLARRYSRERRGECQSQRRRNFNVRTSRTMIECGNLNNLISKNDSCKRLENNSKFQAKCLLELAQKMKEDLEFSDFSDILGKDNIYVFGVINGFRKDSEILNEPIRSNSLGRVKGRHWNGPIDQVREIMDFQNGEFNGLWIREAL